jgi:hypothetical protein
MLLKVVLLFVFFLPFCVGFTAFKGMGCTALYPLTSTEDSNEPLPYKVFKNLKIVTLFLVPPACGFF